MAKKESDQLELIDTSHPAHAKLKKLARAYISRREEFTEARVPVTEAKQRLIDAMNEAGLEHFKIEDLEIVLKHGKDSVKVSIAGDNEEEEED